MTIAVVGIFKKKLITCLLVMNFDFLLISCKFSKNQGGPPQITSKILGCKSLSTANTLAYSGFIELVCGCLD